MEFRCLVEDNAPAEEPILRSAVGTRDTVDSQWDVSRERERDRATETETETETDRQTDRQTERKHIILVHTSDHTLKYILKCGPDGGGRWPLPGEDTGKIAWQQQKESKIEAQTRLYQGC